MDIKELNAELREKSISCGLCNKWQEEWKQEWGLDKMISQFYRGLDFFLKKRFVSCEYIKTNFDRDFLRKNGILADDTYSLLNPDTSILIGNSKSTVRVNGFKSSNIYVVDNGSLKVIAKNKSFVLVHALDNAHIDAHCYDNARLVVIKHSHDVYIEGNAIIKEEYDYLK